MFRRAAAVLLALFISIGSAARTTGADSLGVVFWNVENFFDWRASGPESPDAEYSSSGVRRWTARRFYAKCSGIAKVLMMIADRTGSPPDAVGFAEVENSFVVKQLLSSTVLGKLDYVPVHFDSPDHRGIDCALIYRRSSLVLEDAVPVHVYDSSGAVMATRDILLVRFDSLAVLVNHHPSKVGGREDRRTRAMERMRAVCDSLSASGCGRVICIGDFNDDLWHLGGRGTIKYQGSWEKIDGCFSSGFSRVDETVFDDPVLLEADRGWGGMKPRRTYVGKRYNKGISDHLPVLFSVYF